MPMNPLYNIKSSFSRFEIYHHSTSSPQLLGYAETTVEDIVASNGTGFNVQLKGDPKEKGSMVRVINVLDVKLFVFRAYQLPGFRELQHPSCRRQQRGVALQGTAHHHLRVAHRGRRKKKTSAELSQTDR